MPFMRSATAKVALPDLLRRPLNVLCIDPGSYGLCLVISVLWIEVGWSWWPKASKYHSGTYMGPKVSTR